VPGHGNGKGDRNPSLAITQVGEKFLFKCFGGCDQEDVFAAIKPHLPNSLNWNRPLVARDPLSGIRPIVPPTIKEVMAWDYIDKTVKSQLKKSGMTLKVVVRRTANITSSISSAYQRSAIGRRYRLAYRS